MPTGYPTFRPGDKLPAAVVNQMTTDINALQVSDDTLTAAVTYVVPENYANVSGDAQPAIQAAVDACFNAGGGTVLLKGSTYRVSTAIQLKQGVTLAGMRGDYTTIRPLANTNFAIVRIVGGRATLRDVQIASEAFYVEGVTWPLQTAVRIEAPRARLFNVMGAFMTRGIDCRNYGGHLIVNPDMRRMKDFYYIVGGGSSGQYVGDCTWIAPLAYTDFPDGSVSADANQGVSFYCGSGCNAQYIIGLQTAGPDRGLVMDDNNLWAPPENIFLSGTTIIDAPFNRAVDLVRGKRFSVVGGKISSRNSTGVFVNGTFTGSVDLYNTDIARCGTDGAYVQTGTAQVQFIDCNIVSNSENTANTNDGLVIEAGTTVNARGCQFTSDGYNTLTEDQRYGLRVGDGTASTGTVSGCYFRGNATGGALLGTAASGLAVRDNTGPQAPAPNVVQPVASYTVANLPSAAAGTVAYATNGRKNGEGAGAGTGVQVYRDATAWRRVSDDTTVVA